ncbi:hypothetical protein B0H16DRAFT_1725740 [Mycena metata]|uniref:Uncharacterized protein n=1 Tax=Mycena metata TaxID=1033252 RepID=A0AAD7N6S8_9AGAR|nr:hypothetical protein B0H16DRAFT_1725740 [Mycena metata]
MDALSPCVLSHHPSPSSLPPLAVPNVARWRSRRRVPPRARTRACPLLRRACILLPPMSPSSFPRPFPPRSLVPSRAPDLSHPFPHPVPCVRPTLVRVHRRTTHPPAHAPVRAPASNAGVICAHSHRTRRELRVCACVQMPLPHLRRVRVQMPLPHLHCACRVPARTDRGAQVSALPPIPAPDFSTHTLSLLLPSHPIPSYRPHTSPRTHTPPRAATPCSYIHTLNTIHSRTKLTAGFEFSSMNLRGIQNLPRIWGLEAFKRVKP